jgi:hypothetical protein
MGAQAYRDAVELAVDRWNAHDERYFEAYTEDASMHGFPATVPPTVEGIRALFGAMWAAFPDIRVEIEHLGVELMRLLSCWERPRTDEVRTHFQEEVVALLR